MASGITLDMTRFRAGLAAKLRASKRSAPEIANKAAKNVCLLAMKYTPKADAAAIQRELTSGGLAFRLLQAQSFQGRLPKRLQGYTRGTHSRRELDEAARKLVAQRRRSAGYIRSGWIKAAQAFGGAARGRVSDKGLAGQGYGKAASIGSPVAEAANLARGASVVGAEAMQRALNEVGSDMAAYAAKNLAASWQ